MRTAQVVRRTKIYELCQIFVNSYPLLFFKWIVSSCICDLLLCLSILCTISVIINIQMFNILFDNHSIGIYLCRFKYCISISIIICFHFT